MPVVDIGSLDPLRLLRDSKPLLVIHIRDGLFDRCLPSHESAAYHLGLHVAALQILGNDAFVLPIHCLDEAGRRGSRFGLFIRPPRSDAEKSLFERNLRGPLTIDPQNNLTVLVSLRLFNRLAKDAVPDLNAELDADPALQGVTVESIAVEVEDGRVVTRVKARKDAFPLPIRFTLSLTDRFSASVAKTNGDTVDLETPDGPRSFPERRIPCRSDLERTGGVAAAIFDALVFHLLGILAVSMASLAKLPVVSFGGLIRDAKKPPPEAAGAGCTFVSSLPDGILLPLLPGDTVLQKVALSYERVRIDGDGLELVGKIQKQPRRPRIVAIRPATTLAFGGESEKKVVFSAETSDMKEPLSFTWSSPDGIVSQPGAVHPRVTYDLGGAQPGDVVERGVAVSIRDDDLADDQPPFEAQHTVRIGVVDPDVLPIAPVSLTARSGAD